MSGAAFRENDQLKSHLRALYRYRWSECGKKLIHYKIMTQTWPNTQNFQKSIPEGDDQIRQQCTHCGFVDYQNPKIVVGSVASWNEKILICRRAIEPRKGFWTIPAGYLELNETPEMGAVREAREEACAQLQIDRLLAIYSVSRISQVQLIFRASLKTEKIAPGIESLEAALVDWDDIPWDDLAFPTVHWALRHFDASRDKSDFPPFTNPHETEGPGI